MRVKGLTDKDTQDLAQLVKGNLLQVGELPSKMRGPVNEAVESLKAAEAAAAAEAAKTAEAEKKPQKRNKKDEKPKS